MRNPSGAEDTGIEDGVNEDEGVGIGDVAVGLSGVSLGTIVVVIVGT